MTEHAPYVINPEAVGDPNATPMVQLPPSIAAALNRMACRECGWINHSHAPGCGNAASTMTGTDGLAKALADYRHVEAMVRSCMAGPDALDDARATLSLYGDPAVLLGEKETGDE